MNNSFNDKNSVYALNDGWTGSAWTYTYGYIMTAAQKSEKINQEQKGLLGVTKILKVELMHRIADTYGPIVYTKFGQEEGDNVDSQEAAYRQFFKEFGRRSQTDQRNIRKPMPLSNLLLLPIF